MTKKNITGHFSLVNGGGIYSPPHEHTQVFRQLEALYGIEGIRGVDGYFHGTYYECKEGWETLLLIDERELYEVIIYYGDEDHLVINGDFRFVTPILEDIMHESDFSVYGDEESRFIHGEQP